jgi:hypothetical protein
VTATQESAESRARRLAYQRAYYAAKKDAIRQQRRSHAESRIRQGIPRSKKPLTESQKAAISERNKAYYAANRDRMVQKSASWRQANSERFKETSAAYRKKHGQASMRKMLNDPIRRDRHYKRLHAWQKSKMQKDPCFGIYRRVMGQMSRAMRKHMAGGAVTQQFKIVQLLGCDWMDFILHIEAQFLPGMTWQNHGLSGWHFDHIRPLSSFDLTDPRQLSEGCHFTNVQPLWAADNIRKGGKVA